MYVQTHMAIYEAEIHLCVGGLVCVRVCVHTHGEN